jgi:hypothetical protein
MESKMISELENSPVGVQRSRRNIVKMGAILVPVLLSRIKSAQAKPTLWKFFSALQLFPQGDED